MKKVFAMLGAAVLISPVVATAATYNYVDMTGMVESIEASSPMQAMTLATDIHPRSGVALDEDDMDAGTAIGGSGDTSGGTANTYHYVTVDGEVKTVSAPSAAQVLMMSDIHPHSGVAVDEGLLDEGTDVPGT
jgi:hypothetical protein